MISKGTSHPVQLVWQMNIFAISLIASLALAYKPGGLQPIVQSLVNFGQNPFQIDQSGANQNAFSQLPGHTGGQVIGNVFTSASNDLQLFISNQKFEVPGLGGEIEVRGDMAFQAEVESGLILSPAGIDLDPLYGASQFGAIDLSQGWIFTMIQTNLRVYALYGRLPYGQSLVNNYYSFSYLVPIATRGLHTSNDMSIVMNKAHFTVSYRIEGVERLYIERIGGPLDRQFQFSDEGGIIQCMGFPNTFQILIGTGLLVKAGNPYTACQSSNVFDQCIENYLEADNVVCDYYLAQDPSTYVIDYTLTVEFFTVVEWGPNFDCLQPNNMDVANPRGEPLCFGGCPATIAITPPANGCGIPVVHNCCSSSENESDIRGCCPPIYRRHSVSIASQSDSNCPIVYRRVHKTKSSSCSPSSSSSSNCRRRRHRHRRHHKSTSSSSSSSGNHAWPCHRVEWGHKHEDEAPLPARLRYDRYPERRGPYWSPKNLEA